MNYYFLYDNSTGIIEQATLYEGDEWTNVPTGQGVLGVYPQDSDYTTAQDAFDNRDHYIVSDGKLLEVSNINDILLQEAIANKVAELKLDCFNSLQTFTSSALGAPHTYQSKDSDIALLNGEYAYVKGSDYKGETIPWYTLENGYVNHNETQFVQIYLDGRKYVQSMKIKYDIKEKQTKSCTSIDQVNSIVWNDTTAPAVPRGLEVATPTTPVSGQVQLQWTTNTEIDLAGYNVYQDNVKINASVVTTNNDTITGLTSGSTYNFSVTAIDTDGNESAQCTAVSATVV